MTACPPLDQLLTDSAAQHPTRPAVIDPAHGTIDYATLADRARRMAHLLRDHGVRPGDRVGLATPKSIGAVVAIFGALRAGAAYVPVDAGAPPARNATIFLDCGVRALVITRSLIEQHAAELPGLVELVSLDHLGGPGDDLVLARIGEVAGGNAAIANAAIANDAASDAVAADAVAAAGAFDDSLAYILYTSGSTGRPKGVMHSHASARAFIDWCTDEFSPTAEDRFSSHAPFHFDLSILDIYVPIKHGAAIVLIGESLGKQPMRLAPVIAEQHITVWYSTPSILRLLVEFGKLAALDCTALRYVFFAGEVYPIKHLQALQSVWPHPRYYNLYGPTETNVCTYYEAPVPLDAGRSQPLPIGAACSGDRGRVVDAGGHDVSPGSEGELIIAGGSVMRGYWNLPERNAEAFAVDEHGAMWYRTGDIVKEETPGSYVFVGRRDRMVKRRGYRVELGEIESALYGLPAVSEAAVIALPDADAGVRVRAFLNWSAEGKPSMIELKRFCADNLPAYMIPDAFSVLPSLPKTSTDKIDYQRLKEID